MKNSNCIIITQKEWLNWLAFGYLRVSPSRISYFDNTESESSFDKLMSYSVDNALDEEDAYLIASLVNDYSREELHVKRTSLSDYILVQAVQGFYTLSAKGADLLEYEAGQSHSILHYDSKIENLWNEWKNTQFKLRSHDKGNKFLEILEYPRFEVEPKINDEHLFSLTLKNYNLRSLHPQLQDRQKRSSFAWLVINQEFKEKIGRSLYLKYYEFRQNNRNLEIQDIAKTYKKLENHFITDNTQSLFDYPLLIAEKYFFDKWHSDNTEPKEDYLASTILVHYYNILENNYEINILSLSKDLMLLDEIYSTKNISQLIAYFIGRRLNEVYLNSLYIAKNIDEKKSSMFDSYFFSNLKKEKLMSCNIDQFQLQDIISKVNVIAEQIQLAYNMEVNNVQDSESESDAIEGKDNNLNSPTESQAPRLDSDNSETNNTLIEKLDIANNTTDNNSTQPHLEALNSVESEDSVDSTNMIRNKNEDSTEPVIDSNFDDDDDNLDQPDSDHYMDLALDIHEKLSRENNNKGKDFITQFFERIDDLTKSKLKHNTNQEFFHLFGELIGDKNSYKDITYPKFKAILNKKKEPELRM